MGECWRQNKNIFNCLKSVCKFILKDTDLSHISIDKSCVCPKLGTLAILPPYFDCLSLPKYLEIVIFFVCKYTTGVAGNMDSTRMWNGGRGGGVHIPQLSLPGFAYSLLHRYINFI